MLKKWFSIFLKKLQGNMAGQSSGKNVCLVLLGAVICSVQYEQNAFTWTTAQAEAARSDMPSSP